MSLDIYFTDSLQRLKEGMEALSANDVRLACDSLTLDLKTAETLEGRLPLALRVELAYRMATVLANLPANSNPQIVDRVKTTIREVEDGR